MTDSDDRATVDWRTPLSGFALIAGVALIAVSMFWPSSATAGRSNWSPQQAKQYQHASARLHELSHTPEHPTPAEIKAHDRELQQAEAEFKTIRADLDSAIGSSAKTTTILRLAGAVLIITGCIALYQRRAPSPKRP